MHEGVGQGTDADLERAAVAHQRAGLEAESELDDLHRLARQGEQRVRARRIVQQQVEESFPHLGLVADEGQRGVDDSNNQRPRPPVGRHRVQQVLSDVEALGAVPVGVLLADQLDLGIFLHRLLESGAALGAGRVAARPEDGDDLAAAAHRLEQLLGDGIALRLTVELAVGDPVLRLRVQRPVLHEEGHAVDPGLLAQLDQRRGIRR